MDDVSLTDLIAEAKGIELENLCSCGGLGTKAYPNTTTWGGGVGGQTVTSDVCDRCWGSGDLSRKGADLRAITSAIKKKDREIDAMWNHQRALLMMAALGVMAHGEEVEKDGEARVLRLDIPESRVDEIMDDGQPFEVRNSPQFDRKVFRVEVLLYPKDGDDDES